MEYTTHITKAIFDFDFRPLSDGVGAFERSAATGLKGFFGAPSTAAEVLEVIMPRHPTVFYFCTGSSGHALLEAFLLDTAMARMGFDQSDHFWSLTFRLRTPPQSD